LAEWECVITPRWAMKGAEKADIVAEVGVKKQF
jgi:hypothetical protein